MSEDFLKSVLADIQTGILLNPPESGVRHNFEDLAAVAPELFSAVAVSWETLFAAFEAPPGDAGFQDIILVSKDTIYVAQRFRDDPHLALLSAAPAEKGLGLVLSSARSGVTALAEKK